MQDIEYLKNSVEYLKKEVEKLKTFKQDKVIDRQINEGFNLLTTTSLTNTIKVDLNDSINLNDLNLLNAWRIDNCIYYYVAQIVDGSEIKYIIKFDSVSKQETKLEVESILSAEVKGVVGDYVYIKTTNGDFSKYNFVTNKTEKLIASIGNGYTYMMNDNRLFAYAFQTDGLILKYYDENTSSWIDISDEVNVIDILNNTFDEIFGAVMCICLKDGHLSGLMFRDEAYLYKYKLVKGFKDRLEYCYKLPITIYDPKLCATNSEFFILEEYIEGYIIYLNYNEDYYYSFKIHNVNEHCYGVNEISILYAPYVGNIYNGEYYAMVGYSDLEYTYYK